MRTKWSAAALLAASVVVLTACSSAVVSGAGSSSSPAGSSAAAGSGANISDSGATANAPYVYKASWGTFTLAPNIASDLKSQKPLKVVLSLASLTIPIYASQFQYAFPLGLQSGEAASGVKLTGKVIGPVTANAAQQVSQIESLAAANQIDCLALDTSGDPSLAPAINKLISQGIPVFTVSADLANTHRLGTFQVNYTDEGQQAAQATVDFMKAKNIPIKSVAMTSGATPAIWAQTRMQSFESEMKKLVPGVQFLTDAKTALNTGFTPSDVYSDVRSFLTGHPDVQVIYQTDTGATTINKVITDLGRQGKTFVIGHNVDLPTLQAIQQGTQIATLDQNFVAQSKFAGDACAAFLGKGKVLPNENKSLLITKSNAAEARTAFQQSTGGK
jgi:ABC-type sugar transport system substrate-binding protein